MILIGVAIIAVAALQGEREVFVQNVKLLLTCFFGGASIVGTGWAIWRGRNP